jgi:hypothetical protein
VLIHAYTGFVEASPLDYNRPALSPKSWPKGLIDWNGYLLPPRGRTYRWDELIEIALANGYRLTPAMLHKWRVWRFIPGPKPGGFTGKGPGKGQQWPHESAYRVAWISRWISAGLTYDVLRLALWWSTPDLDGDRRIGEVQASLQRCLEQDRKWHSVQLNFDDLTADAKEESLDRMPEGTESRIYTDVVVMGESRDDERRAAVKGSLPNSPPSEVESQLPFFERMNFDDMEETMATISTDLLRESIAAFRASTTSRCDELISLFWGSPLDLARVITRETHRYALLESGELLEPQVIITKTPQER